MTLRLHSPCGCGTLSSEWGSGAVRAVRLADLGSLAWRIFCAAIAFVLHGLLIVCVLAVVRGVEGAFHLFWPDIGPLLFDRLPLSWLTNAIDGVFFLVFGTFGIVEAFQILRGK
jgi:hypothetical protein